MWRNDRLWACRAAFSTFAEQFGDRYLTSMDHVCLGLSLARLQSVLAIGTLVRDWQVSFTDPPSLRYKLSGALAPARGIELTIQPRRQEPLRVC